MKLVELLARELEEWPDPDAVAVQDKDKEVRFEVGSGTCAHDFVAYDLAEEDMTISDPWDGIPWAGRVTYEEWVAERARIETPAWNGEGLPPVGLLCEARWPGGTAPRWDAFVIRYIGERLLIAIVDGVEQGYLIDDLAGKKVEFRLAPTPEQITAEERGRAIDAMKLVFATVSHQMMPISN